MTPITFGSAVELSSTSNWTSLVVAISAAVIAAASLGLTMWRAKQQTKESKAATFLLLQRALTEPEMQKGREILGRPDITGDEFISWKNSPNETFRETRRLAGRAMATLDVLALHAEMGMIEERAVLAEWGRVLRRLQPGFDAYLASREDGEKIWKHLKALAAKAEEEGED